MKNYINPKLKFIVLSGKKIRFNFLNIRKQDNNKLFYQLNKKIVGIRLFGNENPEIEVQLKNNFNVINFICSNNGVKKIICKKYIFVINRSRTISFIYTLLKILYSLKPSFYNPDSFITIRNNSKININGKISDFQSNHRYYLSCGNNYTKIKVNKNGLFNTDFKLGHGIKFIKLINSNYNTLIDLKVIFNTRNLVERQISEVDDYSSWNNLYNREIEKRNYISFNSTVINIFLNAINSELVDIEEFINRFSNNDMKNIYIHIITNNLYFKKYIFSKKVNLIYECNSFTSAINKNIYKLKSGFTLFTTTNTEFPSDFINVISSNINKEVKLLYFDEYTSTLRTNFQFKPSFDKIYLLSKNYIGTHFCISNELLKKNTLSEKSGICPFYDLLLKTCFILNKSEVMHLPLIIRNNDIILNNKTVSNKTLQLFSSNDLQLCSRFGSYSLLPPVFKTNNSVSLIITTAGDIQLLNNFLTSIINRTTKINYDIIIVTHSSNFLNPDKSNYFNNISSSSIRVIKHNISPFNYSSIVNHAVSYSNSSYICL